VAQVADKKLQPLSFPQKIGSAIESLISEYQFVSLNKAKENPENAKINLNFEN